METPYKKVIVFDLETGGFKPSVHNITEIACVVLDFVSLDVVEEMSVTIQPWLPLDFMSTCPVKKSKEIFMSSASGEKGKTKYLTYKGEQLKITELSPLVRDIESFIEHLKNNGDYMEDVTVSTKKKKEKDYITSVYKEGSKLTLTDILAHQNNPNHKDAMNALLDNAYTQGAFDVTHMNYDMLINEGIPLDNAFEQVKALIERHTEGNSKPIMAGQNIGIMPPLKNGRKVKEAGFDNPMMEQFFNIFGEDYYDLVNVLFFDTLIMARTIWMTLPNYTLGTLCAELDVELTNAHRALPDTQANAKVLIKMLKNARGYGQGSQKYVRKVYSTNY